MKTINISDFINIIHLHGLHCEPVVLLMCFFSQDPKRIYQLLNLDPPWVMRCVFLLIHDKRVLLQMANI